VPAPLDPAKRAAIEQDIRDGLISRNAIARAHTVSASTVSGIARALEANPDEPTVVEAFDRSIAKRATAAKAADLASRRATLAILAMDDAERIRARFWEEVPTVIGRGDDREVEMLPPDAKDIKELAIAFGIMVDKSRALDTSDVDPAKQAAGVVTDLFAGLRAQRDAERAAS
jgi:hypothetical protein